tara:strand:+ start:1428 stop:2042 length:615 start_codon:yes stop_codon:yes gene_type:complete
MKSFIHYITEVATAKHTVGRGNRSGIGKVSRVTPSHTNERRDTIYHHPHEDGERHMSVRFTSHEPKHKKHHDSEEMITGVHDSKRDFKRWHSTPVIGDVGVAQPAVLAKRGDTKPHHQMKHESKKHSILHHHLSNTKANTVTSTTAREYDRDTGVLKPGMGRKGNITARKSKRTPHPDWTYSNDSENALSTNAENIQHTWTRKT